MTLAVENNRLTSRGFSQPTTKVGVQHDEGPAAVLERMLTLRIHLDPATLGKVSLCVIPGSHQSGKTMELDDRGAVPILANPADVWAIRPPVSHGSRSSNEITTLHRRILHFEFAVV